MKHIVCSGCSFTRHAKRLNIDGTDLDYMNDNSNLYRWPHYIRKYSNEDEYTIYNLGNPTNDNSLIRKSIIWKVNKLIKDGVNPSDIQVFVQWSSWQRNSFFISPKHSFFKKTNINYVNDTNNIYSHINDFIESKVKPGEFGYYLLTGGGHFSHLPYKIKEIIGEYYLHFYNIEESLIRFFENILYLQNYLNNKDINYLCFNLQNNFSKIYTSVDGFPELWNEKNIFNSLYVEKYIPKTIEDDYNLEYNNEYIDHLFEQIDFNNFWFFENEDTKYGGLMEWSIKNYNIDEDNLENGLWMEFAKESNKNLDIESLKKELSKESIWPVGHPSNMMNEKFVKEVILDKLI